MNDTLLVIVTTLCSGLVATVVTLWWQYKAKLKNDKKKIFTILMSKRYEISAEESVEALNMIDVVFYKAKKVRNAWKEFYDITKAPETKGKLQAIADKHLKLLEVMAEDIGYKKINWEDIKQYYYPIGLSDKKEDEKLSRKVQIGAGLVQMKKENENNNDTQVDRKVR